MRQRTLPISARKPLAAVWFSAFGFLAAALFFLHPPVALRAVVLYVLLPTVSAGVAGYAWGGPILDPEKKWSESLLRSLGITAGAYVVFAVLFACCLPVLERGWSLRQTGGLFLMTLTLGLLMVGRWILLAGMVAGFTLHKLGCSVFD